MAHRAEAKMSLTPGSPPQEREFISPMRKGKPSSCARATEAATAFAPEVAAESCSKKSGGFVLPLQWVPAYQWWLTIASDGDSCARNSGSRGSWDALAQDGPINNTSGGSS